MNEQQIARLRYLTDVLENVDTDMMIYMDDPEEIAYLKIDRDRAEFELKTYMWELVK